MRGGATLSPIAAETQHRRTGQMTFPRCHRKFRARGAGRTAAPTGEALSSGSRPHRSELGRKRCRESKRTSFNTRSRAGSARPRAWRTNEELREREPSPRSCRCREGLATSWRWRWRRSLALPHQPAPLARGRAGPTGSAQLASAGPPPPPLPPLPPQSVVSCEAAAVKGRRQAVGTGPARDSVYPSSGRERERQQVFGSFPLPPFLVDFL